MKVLAHIAVVGLLVGTALTLSGCPSRPFVEMNVRGYGDPEMDYQPLRRFDMVSLNEQQPLLEKELLHLLKQELENKGFVHDEVAPDFLVVLSFYVGAYQYYRPPRSITLPYYVRGERKTTSGWIGQEFVSLTERGSGRWESKDIEISSGGMATAHYRNIRIDLVDFKHLVATDSVSLLWTGEVDSHGSTSDLLVVAPVMIDEVLDEYPHRSTRGTVRFRSDHKYYRPQDELASRVYISTRDSLFHWRSCSSLLDPTEKVSREEALARGFRACLECRP